MARDDAAPQIIAAAWPKTDDHGGDSANALRQRRPRHRVDRQNRRQRQPLCILHGALLIWRESHQIAAGVNQRTAPPVRAGKGASPPTGCLMEV